MVTTGHKISPTVPDLLPVRMLNEYAYCPRLFHMMHVQGLWAENEFTVQGRQVHKRVDKLDHVLPDAEHDTDKKPSDHVSEKDASAPGEEPPEISSSVSLGSDRLGLTAKLDLVSTADNEAVPVERKRGHVPNNPERSWEPERVQLMAQGLLLRENGYTCDHGILYFAASRTRVRIDFTPALESRTFELLAKARKLAETPQTPLPLEDSPKCNGCSLAGICLPDETLALKAMEEGQEQPDVRRMFPARDSALPFYVQEQGATVGKKSKTLVVRKSGEELAVARFKDVSQLVLCGNIQVSAQTIHALCEAGIPIVHLSGSGWFYGITHNLGPKNGYTRLAQYQASQNEMRCLAFAKAVVSAKGANQRTFLMRNTTPRPTLALDDMARMLGKVDEASNLQSLLGLEGTIAASYFSAFANMLKEPGIGWNFAHRNRRPPLDPVNAMLSFGYALLVKECTMVLLTEGLDPYWGLYHQPRHGRPAMALDLMEEFRVIVVDSAVISAVNNGMVKPSNFRTSSAGCVMLPKARKALIKAYEARLDQLINHPVFDYRCSWRSIIRIQARLLARWLRGEIATYKGFTTR